jgi:hypothetical protein
MRRRIAYSFVRIQPLSAPPIDTLAASPVMTGPLAARLLCDEPSAGVARLLRSSLSSARSL